jgi:hypothetical protein
MAISAFQSCSSVCLLLLIAHLSSHRSRREHGQVIAYNSQRRWVRLCHFVISKLRDLVFLHRYSVLCCPALYVVLFRKIHFGAHNVSIGVSVANVAVVVSPPVSRIHREGYSRFIYPSPYIIAWLHVHLNSVSETFRWTRVIITQKTSPSLESVLYAVLTARTILNIRHMGNQSLQTELHTVDEEPGLVSPLQFVRHTGGSQSVQEPTAGGESHDESVGP